MPAFTRGSNSSCSSMVQPHLIKSVWVANLSTFWFNKCLYGIGWRTATGFFHLAIRVLQTYLVTPLFPQPVLTAHTEITGFFALSIVFSAPRIKFAPRAVTRDALC